VASLGGARQQLAAGIKEFEAAQLENAEQASSWMNLGNLHAALGDVEQAQADYQAAIRLEPAFVPAYVNFADLKSSAGENPVAVTLLQTALEAAPDNPVLQHALGLALTREKRYDEAIRALGRAVKGDPVNARYAYVYGVALHDTGKPQQGVAVLQDALNKNPGDRDLLTALAAYAQAAGDMAAAADYKMRLQRIETGDERAEP
jgi:tetratricopeptide (TPR) repeat protein